jgi:hypothetical protein
MTQYQEDLDRIVGFVEAAAKNLPNGRWAPSAWIKAAATIW